MATAAELIREARREAGLTQTDVARRAGTSQAAIARYEAGRASPSVLTLERILRVTGNQLSLARVPARRTDLSTPQGVTLRKHRKQVLDMARSCGARNVRLFGSVARGEARPDSDIDLMVDFETGARGLLPLADLSSALTTLLGYTVEVVPCDVLTTAVLASAHVDAVEL